MSFSRSFQIHGNVHPPGDKGSEACVCASVAMFSRLNVSRAFVLAFNATCEMKHNPIR